MAPILTFSSYLVASKLCLSNNSCQSWLTRIPHTRWILRKLETEIHHPACCCFITALLQPIWGKKLWRCALNKQVRKVWSLSVAVFELLISSCFEISSVSYWDLDKNLSVSKHVFFERVKKQKTRGFRTEMVMALSLYLILFRLRSQIRLHRQTELAYSQTSTSSVSRMAPWVEEVLW